MEFNESDSLSNRAITQAIYESFCRKGGMEFAEEAVEYMQDAYQEIHRHWFPGNYQTLFYLGYCFGRREEVEALAQSHDFLTRWLASDDQEDPD